MKYNKRFLFRVSIGQLRIAYFKIKQSNAYITLQFILYKFHPFIYKFNETRQPFMMIMEIIDEMKRKEFIMYCT